MPRNFSRTNRIAGLIQTELAEILLKNSEDARFQLVTITGVKISRDLSFAKVYVSVLEEEKAKEIVSALNNAARYLRFTLAKQIDLRVTPELHFYYDDSSIKGHHISVLLNKALNKK